MGVTVPTVSKVLNGRSDVSPSTRQRVSDRLQEAGYSLGPVPASAESSARQGSSALIDLVVPGVQGSWVTSMLSGVEEVVSESGRDVVVTVAHRRTSGPSWVERLIARGSRATVLALVAPTAAEFAALQAAQVHVVALDPGADPTPGVPAIGATNWAGGYSATEHLLGLGHRRIGLVAGLAQHRYSRARIDGYRSALEAAGVPVDPELIRHGDWTRSGAAEAVEHLLRLKDRPTAIFACSDRMALGAYEQAAALGLRIPEDLSVVGFDDLPEARWLTPALTTVRQPVREMGATAARMLLQALEGVNGAAADRQPTVDRLELSTQLVVRDSTVARVG